jgi:hypothetical protein
MSFSEQSVAWKMSLSSVLSWLTNACTVAWQSCWMVLSLASAMPRAHEVPLTLGQHLLSFCLLSSYALQRVIGETVVEVWVWGMLLRRGTAAAERWTLAKACFGIDGLLLGYNK